MRHVKGTFQNTFLYLFRRNSNNSTGKFWLVQGMAKTKSVHKVNKKGVRETKYKAKKEEMVRNRPGRDM